MPTRRHELPVVTRSRYEGAVRERDDWELRARIAAERALATSRSFKPPPRRSRVAALLACGWLVVLGIFVGGAVIPHHEERPTISPDLTGPAAGRGTVGGP